MQDLPSKTTLLGGVARFLSEEVVPNTADRGRAFRVRIAAHLVASVAREIEFGEAHDADELNRLSALFDLEPPEAQGDTARRGTLHTLNDRLADGIRNGDPALDLAAVRNHIMATLRDKLAVNQPRFDTRPNPEIPEA